MEKVKDIFNLVKGLIVKPRSTIMSIDIINYDKEVLFKLLIFSIIIFVIAYLALGAIFDPTFFLGIILFGIVLAPFMFMLAIRLNEFIYYLGAKYIGKDIQVPFQTIKVLLDPVYYTVLCLYAGTFLINIIFRNGLIKLILDLGLLIWPLVIIFMIFKDKFNQNVWRSIIISLMPYIIYYLITGGFALFTFLRYRMIL